MIEFFTGFQGCGSTADVISLVTPSEYTEFSATGGYNNGKSVRLSTTIFAGLFVASKAVSPKKTLATGFHVRAASTTALDDQLRRVIVQLQNGSSIRLYNTASGLVVTRGTTVISTYGPVMDAELHHIEVEVFSSSTDGYVVVKLDGVTIIDSAGLNTGGGDFTSCLLGGATNGTTSGVRFTNWYLSDQLEGELISVLCKPSSDSLVQFTPSAGTDNYAMVDDSAQDGDTTYVQSSTVGHVDRYGYEDVPSGYLVKAVSLVTVAKKDGAGTRTLQSIALQDSTNYDVGSEIALATTYPAGVGAGAITTLGLAPDTTAWERSKFNAIEWGFEVRL